MPGPIESPSIEDIQGMIPRHAPPGWQDRYNRDGELVRLIHEGREFLLVTLAADIRLSTILQTQAVSFQLHALTLTRFVEAAGDTVRAVHQGWFDKFTGDGFLAYWVLRVLEPGDPIPLPVVLESDLQHAAWTPILSALNSTMVLHSFFERQVLDDFRANSKNFPDGAGLALGLDAGPAYFAAVAGELTILGPPVVGAVRMVSAAGAGEVLANVQLGRALHKRQEEDPVFGVAEVAREFRASKEFPQGQEVYNVRLDLDQIRELGEMPGNSGGS